MATQGKRITKSEQEKLDEQVKIAKEKYFNDTLKNIILNPIQGDTKHASLQALERLNTLYHALTKLDRDSCNLIPNNVAQGLISNRESKSLKVQGVCYFNNDSNPHMVIIPQGMKPTKGHDYTYENLGVENDVPNTSETLLGNYGRGYNGSVEYDARESLFVLAYLLDQNLSGQAWSAEQSLKSMGMRTILNAMSKVRISLDWKIKGKPVTIVYEYSDIESRALSYMPNWRIVLTSDLAKSISGVSAVTKIDTSKVAKVDESLLVDF